MKIDGIDDAVITCISYFDGFDYPLKAEEIHSFLPGYEVSVETLKKALHNSPLNHIIECQNGYYFFSDRSADIITQRHTAEKIAGKRWRTAQRMTNIIKMFPYVRAIMISGDLSKNVSSHESDIDYFILVKPGHLWITRSLLTLFKKTILLNDKTNCCLNFFRSTDFLGFDNMQDYFTATEIFTLKAVYNTPWFGKLLDENRWVYTYFPNHKLNGALNNNSSDSRSVVQVITEKFLDLFPLDRLDTGIMDYMKEVWRKRYAALSEEDRTYRFRCTKDESTAFVEESKHAIMKKHAMRVKQIKQQLMKLKISDAHYD